MGHAYTPGLKVRENAVLQKERRLPLKGKVLVKQGQHVKAEEVVARTDLPGNVQLINIVNKLGILPEDIDEVMIKKAQDPVTKDEIIAQTNGLFGLFKSTVKSPVNGTMETISNVTGQLIIRETPIPVEVKAYIDGEVVEASADEYAIIEARATFIQGIFGIGGETIGEIKIVSSDPAAVLTPQDIPSDCRGKILVGGSLVTHETVKQAIANGARGIIVGGVNDWDIRGILGYDIGVAITGSEDIGITLVITEGFGQMTMAARTFDLLKSREGMKASISGATQIRAGVMRPEVIIPLDNKAAAGATREESEGMLQMGTLLRIIREPHFGQLGKVSALPAELQVLPTESKVRVLEVTLANNEKVILPRANIEIIEK
ncbi:hypothetical protein ACFL5I_01285 [Planctomycetota bacterium]